MATIYQHGRRTDKQMNRQLSGAIYSVHGTQ